MARIVKRTGVRVPRSYLLRVSCGYQNGKQQTHAITWRPPQDMSERQADRMAGRVAADFERTMHRGSVLNPSNPTLAEFCAEYLDWKRPTLSASGLRYQQETLNRLILPALGNVRLLDLQPVHIQRFLNELQERPRAGGGTLAASSVMRYFTVLKSVLATAYKLGYIAQNPSDAARLTLPGIAERETEVFSEAETAVLLSALEHEPLQWQLLVNLAIVTGARRGELCALRWENIDLPRSCIRILCSCCRAPGGTVEVKEPKTRKSVRTVTFDAQCDVLLRQWRAAQGEAADWLFPRADGNPISPGSVSAWFSRFLARHGLPHRCFHALRHTSGTLLLLRGVNIKTVASRLGHTQLSTVNRYVHALEQADRTAASAFDALRAELCPPEEDEFSQ